ncbi:hypothetical protein [Kibdelosporangium philippinense]|uniref:hypothetical protein n=1 Tax=Kibdelosporangium philippinense TaxID=211113 RepID=UPI00361FDAAE
MTRALSWSARPGSAEPCLHAAARYERFERCDGSSPGGPHSCYCRDFSGLEWPYQRKATCTTGGPEHDLDLSAKSPSKNQQGFR